MHIPEPPYLFVYGTLKLGFPMQEILDLEDDMGLIGNCRVHGKLYDMGQYPALIPGEDWVEGELYKILTPGLLPKLDQYEGFDPFHMEPKGFYRKLIPVPAYGIEAWAYLYGGKVHDLAYLPAGIWPASSINSK